MLAIFYINLVKIKSVWLFEKRDLYFFLGRREYANGTYYTVTQVGFTLWQACRLYVKSLNYPGHLRLLKCSSSNVSGLNYVFFEVCVWCLSPSFFPLSWSLKPGPRAASCLAGGNPGPRMNLHIMFRRGRHRSEGSWMCTQLPCS